MARALGEATEWEAERRHLVEAIRSGRISGREAMDALGVTAATLAGWVSAEKRRRKRAGNANPAFVAIDVRDDGRVSEAAAVVELANGIRVRVEGGFDVEAVARLVKALSNPC